MDSDGVIITSGHHLTSSFLRQDLLEQLLKHGDFVRRQIFSLTPGVTSDPQPDDTARKGLRRRRQLHQHAALVSGVGQPLNPAFARRAVEHARHRARVDGKFLPATG